MRTFTPADETRARLITADKNAKPLEAQWAAHVLAVALREWTARHGRALFTPDDAEIRRYSFKEIRGNQ